MGGGAFQKLRFMRTFINRLSCMHDFIEAFYLEEIYYIMHDFCLAPILHFHALAM